MKKNFTEFLLDLKKWSGYPEQASAELGKRIEEEFLKNAGDALEKAIREADEARANGKRILHDNGANLKIRSV